MAWLGNLAADLIDKIDDAIPGVDLDVIGATKDKVGEVNQLAQDTFELCTGTVAKSCEMLNFADEIKSTLDGFKDGMDASDLKIVKDLIQGDKIQAAMALASEISEVSVSCVEKSLEMTTLMNDGYDRLPDVVKEGIDRAADDGEDGDLSVDVEPDIEELTSCITALKELNLFTAMEAGTNAFNGLSTKADVCTKLYDRIKAFAEAVVSITGSILELDVMAVVGKVKDMCRCIRLSEAMQIFAEQVKKLVLFIIDLFKECSERLSILWSALDYAKDCLTDCAAAACEAKDNCTAAFDHGSDLVETCSSIQEKFAINRSIELAQGMDDVMLGCIDKVVGLVDRVKTGWDGLPAILTEGIEDLMEEGREDDDPEDADTSRDIEELDACRDAVCAANIFEVCGTCTSGFSGLIGKVEVCKAMLQNSQAFADKCNDVVADFMGTWNIETMGKKLKDMCRCFRLGEQMRQFAEQIKNLIMSILGVLRSIWDKIASLWDGLDLAKECLAACAAAALEAKDKCLAAFDHGVGLSETCGTIKDHLDALTDFDANAVMALKSLAQGEDIKRSIDMAQSMDDVMLECIGKVVGLLDKVKEGWDGMPPALRDGIGEEEVKQAGRADDDPDDADTSRDISEVEACMEAMGGASGFELVGTGKDGLSVVVDKIEVCKSMLERSQNFAGNCDEVVADFMGAVNLETVGNKVMQICRCTRIGEVLRQFAEQVKNLVMRIVAFLRSVMDKFGNFDAGDVLSAVLPDGVGDAVSAVADGLGKLGFNF